jgi:hypothetical protein
MQLLKEITPLITTTRTNTIPTLMGITGTPTKIVDNITTEMEAKLTQNIAFPWEMESIVVIVVNSIIMPLRTAGCFEMMMAE